MPDQSPEEKLEELIHQWRTSVDGSRTGEVETAAAELQLRREVLNLTRSGLATDEAFLVAVMRAGRADPRCQELARALSTRGWKQLPLASGAGRKSEASRREAIVAFSCAVLAALAVKLPAWTGRSIAQHGEFYARNASLFVLPCLLGYFVWKRRLSPRWVGTLAAVFGVAALVANLPALGAARDFGALTALHLPIALWLAVGVAYAGGRWNQSGARMNFIRFSGEFLIYYVLIALGGGVFTAFMTLTFHSIGFKIETFFQSWLLPCGAAGAVVVASWLVEAKQGVIEAMAPVLTRLFTPLFAALLVAFLGTLLWSGRGISFERELLIGFDLLLVLVLGLLVYSVSARDPLAPPGAFDVVQVVLVVSALVADAVALWAIGARIGEFGFSPNRVAALGENLLLLVNLAWSAALYGRFLIGRGAFVELERWQTSYLPVFAAWATLVVVAFPLFFRWFG